MPALREIADPLRRDEALGEVRRVSGVEDRVLRQVLDRPARNPIGQGRSSGEGSGGATPGSPPTPSWPRRMRCRSSDILRAVTAAKSELLRLLLLVPDLAAAGHR